MLEAENTFKNDEILKKNDVTAKERSELRKGLRGFDDT